MAKEPWLQDAIASPWEQDEIETPWDADPLEKEPFTPFGAVPEGYKPPADQPPLFPDIFPADQLEKEDGIFATIGKAATQVPPLLKASLGGQAQALGEAFAEGGLDVEALAAKDFTEDDDPFAIPEHLQDQDIDAAQLISDAGKATFLAGMKEAQERAPKVTGGKKFAADVVTATGLMIPTLLVGAMTRNPNAALGMMFPQVYGISYGEAKKQGLTVEQSRLESMVKSSSEMLTERIPIGIILKRGKGVLSKILKSAGAEGAQEFIQSGVEQLIDAGVLRENMTLGEAFKIFQDPKTWKQMGYQALVGTAVGGILGGAATGIDIATTPKPPTPEVIPEEIIPEPGAGMEGVDFVPPETDKIIELAPEPTMPGVDFETAPERVPERYGLAPDEFTEVEPPAYPADLAAEQAVEPPVAPEPEFQPGERGVGLVEPEAELVAPVTPAEKIPTEKPRKIPVGKWNKPADPVTDDLIMATAKLGGISRKEAIAQGIDPAEFKIRRGRPLFPAQGGKTMDSMAEKLSDLGYPVLDEAGKYSPNKLLDSLTSALRGESVYSTQVDPDILAEEQGLFEAEEQAVLEAAKAAAATKLEGRKKSDQEIVESYIANKYGRPATQEEVEAIGEEMKSPDNLVERAAGVIARIEQQMDRGMAAHGDKTMLKEISDLSALIDEMLPAQNVAVKKTKKTKAEKKVKKKKTKPPKYTKEQIKLEEIATRYEAIGKKKDAERVRKASFKEKVDVAEFEGAITEAEKQYEDKIEGKTVEERKEPKKEKPDTEKQDRTIILKSIRDRLATLSKDGTKRIEDMWLDGIEGTVTEVDIISEIDKALSDAKTKETRTEFKRMVDVSGVLEAIDKELSIKKQKDMFDNPPDYSSQTVATGKEKGITVEEAQKVADKFISDYNGPEVKIIVVKDQSVFKKGVKKGDNIKGGFYADYNTVVLVADNIDSNRDAVSTLRHEILSHYGLNLFDQKTRNEILDSIHRSRDGLLLRKVYNEVRKDYKDASDRVMAEEVFSNIAQKQPTKAIAVWDNIVEMVMQALRKIGLMKGYVTKSELRRLVASIGEGIRKGHKPVSKGEGVAFAKKKDPGEKNDADEFTVEWTGTTPASQVNPSPQEVISRIDKYHPNAVKKMKRWSKRNFTKEGLLNKETFEAKIRMDAEKNVGESDVSALTYDMNKAVANAYGKKSYNEVSKEDLANINSYLSGKDVSIPSGLKEQIDHLRAHLDRLSGGMLSALEDLLKIQIGQLSESQRKAFNETMITGEGVIPKPIQKFWNMYQTITNNIGTYITRSYQAFDDPKWKDKVLGNKDLISRAENFIRENNPDLTDGEVTGAVRGILQSAKDSGNFMSFVSKGTKAGTKDISILKKKKEVPVIIRELLGEYKDPKVNYTRSATKMQYYIANHHFLMRVREHGLNDFLFEKPTGEFDTQLAGKLSETLNPLNGLYTTEDFRQGLEDAQDTFIGSNLMRGIIAVNSTIKYGKTILAPTTVSRNFMSAFFFTVMNGHFNMIHTAKAFRAAKSDLFTKDEEWRAYLNKAIKLGVLHDNPFAQELKAAINDFADLDVYSKGKLQTSKRFLSFMQRLYQVGDDFWKIVGFENEITLQMNKGLSRSEAEKKAAYRIRNGYPTYSMVPRQIKFLRRWPIIGTFVSFPYEIVRTSYNQIQFVKEDMKDNPGAAARRVLGMTLASSMAYAVSVASMTSMGMSDDDDEAVRSLLPKWSRNSQLFYTGYDKDGMPTYHDLSYIDPYTYIKKPISALLNNNNEGIDKKIIDALKEFLEPFIGIDIGAGALIEIISNKKEEGGVIYNTEDTAYKQTLDIMDHARKSVQPGVVSNVERTAKALGGRVSKTGRKYDVSDELFAWVGFRAGTLDIPTSMIYKSYAFMDRKIRSTKILTGKVGSQSKISDAEIITATNEMMVARERAYKDMIKLVGSARKLGMTKMKLRRVMSSAGVSNKDVSALVRGKVPRWRVSGTFMKSARDRAMSTAPNMKRRTELRKEMAHRIRLVRKTVRNRYTKK